MQVSLSLSQLYLNVEVCYRIPCMILDDLLNMLNRLLRKQFLHISSHASLQRRLNQPVKEEGSVDEQAESNDLKPFEGFPAEEEGNDPDE